MQRLKYSFALLLALFLRPGATTASAAGHISADAAWSADTILVTDTVWVDTGVTLTVNPGTRVEFQGVYALYVKGRVLAQGSVSDSIVFTALDTAAGFGGIRFESVPLAGDTSLFIYCRLEYARNTLSAGPAAWGAGLYLQTPAKARVEHCLIRRNTGQSYGGGIYVSSSFVTLRDNVIVNNSAMTGAGICLNGGSAVVFGNTVSGNIATATGGGITSRYSSPRFINNIVTGNSAGNGGGLHVSLAPVTLVNSLISSNTASNMGGGVFCPDSLLKFINCTVANNSAATGAGGLYTSTTNTAASPVLVNTIFWGNVANNVANQLSLNNYTVQPEIRHCDMQGGLAGMTGNGVPRVYADNLDLDPLFADSAAGDYSLLSGSPCISTGTPDTAGLGLPATDLAGNPRIYDGAVDRVDMGAYEYAGDPVEYMVVTYPVAGNSLSAGSLANLTWTSVGTVDSVKIEFSADSGKSWQVITPSASNTGSFNWAVQDPPSSACVVRVSDAADGFPFAKSSGLFAVVPGEFKLVTPNGAGITWKAGTVHDIVWTSVSGTGNVKLEYSTDSGRTWNTIIASTANDNSYAWTVPGEPSFGCKVRISEAVTGYPFDESDALFGIYDSTLLVTCGTISQDVTWDTDTVRVNCQVVVDTGATLTINPGTRVEFLNRSGIKVMGRLLAEGTAQDSILFTAPDTTPNSTGGWTGIRFRDVAPQSDTSKITCCRIEYVRTFGTSLDGYGGGVFIYATSRVVVSHSTLNNNIAINGGGGICAWSASPVIQNNIIRNNATTHGTFSFGAGVFCQSSSALISENIIRNNQSSREGGGLSCQGGAPRIINNLIVFNTAGNEGGGVRCNESCQAWITGNLIRGNQAVDGGGVFCNRSPLKIYNNTIVGNRGTGGGGIRAEETSPSVKNTILWNNTGGQIVLGYLGGASVEYSDVQGGWTGGGAGNIDAYPMFADSANGGFSFPETSPCVNSGTHDTTGLGLPAADLAGNTRVVGWSVDMGAYECPTATGVEPGLPAEYSLAQNHPNPFNPVTRVRIGIPGPGQKVRATLHVYGTDGRLVKKIFEGHLAPGFHGFEWNGLDDAGKPVSSGFYLVKMRAGSFRRVIRCMLMK